MFMVSSIRTDIPWQFAKDCFASRYVGKFPRHWIMDESARRDIIRSDLVISVESAKNGALNPRIV